MYILRSIGSRLARYLSRPRRDERPVATSTTDRLVAAIRKGDVLLVEGTSRISSGIKYLTQSTWSHAALYIDEDEEFEGEIYKGGRLLEADVNDGVQFVPLSKYWHSHTRICRAVGLSEEEITNVIDHTTARIGHQYDLKNIVDLARYFFPTPPVPSRWRRRLLSMGSGDPTKAICSSLIAEAFQAVRYPILPEAVLSQSSDPACIDCYNEMLHIRHHSLFAPRDFDISPYFQIVKPTVVSGFDPHKLHWVE